MTRHSTSPLRSGFVLAAALLVAVSGAAVAADTRFDHTASYVADGERVALEPALDRFALAAVGGFDLDALHLSLAESLASRASVERLPIDILEIRVGEGSTRGLLRELRRDARVAWAEPVFYYGDTPEYMTGRFLVALEDGVRLADLDEMHALFGAFLREERDGFRYPLFEMQLPADRDLDVLDVVEAYRDVPGVRYVEPVFYFPAAQHVPNDPLFDEQWPLLNDGGNPGTPGADVDADLAWDITRGNPAVIIAIQDEGVDVDHPDLASNVVPGADTTDQAPPGGVPGNADCNDPHGTACAGIAAAQQDNNVGVSGVCPECSIAPVRLGRGGVWTTNTWIADAFNWTRDNDVAVSSNSWGGGSPSSTVTNAINDCFENGRGGLGCLVLASSGNGNTTPVIYPARLENVVAVGASSPCDERKNPSSCDGESFWGSHFGPSLDVVAPGVLYPTTDIVGGCGYEPGDFRIDFNGTSAACPNAAGVAGLIFSRNPSLTAAEVRDLLLQSADDQVGPPNEDTPGRDDFFGHGRVNAHTGVLSVGPLDPPSLLSISPDRGSIAGSTEVTLTGEAFAFLSDVTFDGVAAQNVVFVDENTLVATTPSGAILDSVVVEVITPAGSDNLPDAFTYVPTLDFVGTPSPGATIFLQGFGVPSGDWGVVKDTVLGPRFKKGVLWEIGFRDFEIIKNSFTGGDNPLLPTGQGQAQYIIPDDPKIIGTEIYFEGAYDGNGPAKGRNLTLADLVTVVVVPGS